jgi:hypothetical protein
MKQRVVVLIMAVLIMVWAVAGLAQTNLTVVRHADNTIWKMTCEGTSNCSAWTQIPGGFLVQPTLTWDSGLNKYLLVGIGNNGSNIWRSTFNEDGTWNNDWTLIGSGATGSPSPAALSGAYAGVGTLDSSKIYVKSCQGWCSPPPFCTIAGVASCMCNSPTDILLTGGASCQHPASGFSIFSLNLSTYGSLVPPFTSWIARCVAPADNAQGWAEYPPLQINILCLQQ